MAELLLWLSRDLGTSYSPNTGCSLSSFLQQSCQFRSAHPSSSSAAHPVPRLQPIVLHPALKLSCANGSALPQAPKNPSGSLSFPLGCWGALADPQHRV